MIKTVGIVIAYRDMGCEHRRRAFDYCYSFWREHLPDVPITIGDAEPFSRAAAINAGIRECDADIIFQPDPDTLLVPSDVEEALSLAAWEPGVVNPYNRYVYLNGAASDRVYEEGIAALASGKLVPERDAEAFGPFGSGLAACYSRETWERAGGFDERFGVWAGDDGAFSYAAGVLVAPVRRVAGEAWHLWHPRHPDSVVGSQGYVEQFAILERYRDAGTREEMLAVIEGRRVARA